MSNLKTLAICGITLLCTTGCHGLKGHLLGHGCGSCASSCSTRTVPVYEQKVVCEGCDDDCCEECEDEAQCGLQGCVDEQLRSKLSLDMEQQICFGALQVDMGKLEKLVDARKEQYEEEQKLYDEYVNAQKDHWRAERERQLREYIDSIPSESSCCGPKVSCAPPVCPKFSLPSPPPRCIVGAAEIPFVVPVTLKVGLDQVEINKPHVRRTVTECYEGECTVPCNNGCCGNGCCDNGGGCCDQGCCSTGVGPAPTNGGGYDEAPPAPAAATRRFPSQR